MRALATLRACVISWRTLAGYAAKSRAEATEEQQRLNDAVRDRVPHQFRNIVELQLQHEASSMTLDGSLGDSQIDGDGFIILAFDNSTQNLNLSFAKWFSHGVAPSVLSL